VGSLSSNDAINVPPRRIDTWGMQREFRWVRFRDVADRHHSPDLRGTNPEEFAIAQERACRRGLRSDDLRPWITERRILLGDAPVIGVGSLVVMIAPASGTWCLTRGYAAAAGLLMAAGQRDASAGQRIGIDGTRHGCRRCVSPHGIDLLLPRLLLQHGAQACIALGRGAIVMLREAQSALFFNGLWRLWRNVQLERMARRRRGDHGTASNPAQQATNPTCGHP